MRQIILRFPIKVAIAEKNARKLQYNRRGFCQGDSIELRPFLEVDLCKQLHHMEVGNPHLRPNI